MTHHLFKRTEAGNTKLVPKSGMDLQGFTAPEPPPIPEINTGAVITVHRCGVEDCGKDFSIVALAAKHFKREHESLYENKDSWRAHITEVIIN